MLAAVVRSLQSQGSSVDCVVVLLVEKLKFQYVVLIVTCSHRNKNQECVKQANGVNSIRIGAEEV